MTDRDDVQFTEGEIGFILKRLSVLKNAMKHDLQFVSLDELTGSRIKGVINSIDIVANTLKDSRNERLRHQKGTNGGRFLEPEEQILLVSESDAGVDGAFLCSEEESSNLMTSLIRREKIVSRYWVISDDEQKYTAYKRKSDSGDNQ